MSRAQSGRAGADRARRVLFVSYYAPPYGGPQGFRAAQFMRHLPDSGYSPQLLTVRPSAYSTDPGPSDTVSFGAARRGAIETRTLALDALAGRVKGEGAAPAGPGRAQPSRLARLASLLATPDRLASWIPFAVARGLPAARRSDLIYAAGPPFTNHVVGAALARLAGKPLVVMVDDPWVSMSHGTWYSDRQRRLHERLERASLARADRILAGTEGFGADLANRHPAAVDDKLRLVLWGFEPGDVPREIVPPLTPPVRFVYAGSLRGAHYDPAGLLAALRKLAAEHPDLGDRVSFDFYGLADRRYVESAADLAPIVRFHGFRPHREVAEAIRRGHAGVLLIADTHPELAWYTSAKLFTYAGSERPTLALVPENGDAARLITERRLGVVVPPGDPGAIAAAILRVERDHVALRERMAGVEDLSSAAVVDEAARAFDEALV